MNRPSIMAALIAFLLVGIFIFHPAEATSRHHRSHQAIAQNENCIFSNDGRTHCSGWLASPSLQRTGRSRSRVRDGNGNRAARVADNGTIIGGRPDGCPARYCGCGLRKYLGLADKRLNLASNWARLFPRVAGPAAGVAAVRSGHVMYIEGSAGNGQWLVRDYNSGGGLSRIHVRDVRGYIYVNPHAMLASR